MTILNENPGARTIPERLLEASNGLEDKSAFIFRQDDKWQNLTYGNLLKQVIYLSASLAKQGLQKGDKVAIISENRVEHCIAELAIVCSGAVSVPLYVNSSFSRLEFILNESDARFAFLTESNNTIKKIKNIKDNLNPKIKFIRFTEKEELAEALNYRELIEAGGKYPAKFDFFANLRSLNEEDTATITYTSGTHENPKGVMLSHRNIISNCESAVLALPIDESSVNISVLPLSHALEKTCGFYVFLFQGATTAICENLNMLSKTLKEIAPTHLIGVPKLFDSIHQSILKEISGKSRLARKLFERGLSYATEAFYGRPKNRKPGFQKRLVTQTADRMIFEKIRASLGGKLKLLISGGSPLPIHLGEFFNAIGITIVEGYGLTEASPVISCNRVQNNRFGTVGFPLKDVEVKTSKEGEILARGPNIMKGYYENGQFTKEVIDDEGWLHTGDIGAIDDEGYIKITGKLKDIIVTSKGENVSPQSIESKLMASPHIKQAMVIGEGKDYLCALIVPNTLSARDEGTDSDMEKAEKAISEEIKEINKGFSNFEKIRKFKILSKDFSIDEEELTPTLKLRRKIITQKYSHIIEEMYA